MNKTTESPLSDPKIMEETKEALKNIEEETGKNFAMSSTYIDSEIDFEEDLGVSKKSLNFDIFTENLKDTEHLPGYDLFDEDLGLIGENYQPMKKCLWYYQNSLRQNVISYKINNKTKCDNRKHILIIASASQGKTTIKNQNKRILSDNMNYDGVIEVSGVSHPEQLVGKVVYRGRGDKKHSEDVYGIMFYRCVMNDEAQDMINEENDVYAKSQRIKRLAMDVYGENKISKKLVEDTAQNVLSYYSPSRVCDFMHHKKLSGRFFDTGSFRRYDASNIDFDVDMDLDEITSFDIDKNINKKTWKEFLDENYKSQINEISFTEETTKIISHFHKCLLYYLLKHKNKTAFRYGLLTRYSLRTVFCKNVLILALAKKERTPSLYTTISACRDTLLFIFKSIEAYNELGNMGTSEDVWGGVNENDAQALEYLYRKKSLDRDSSKISIKEFQSVLANFYGCKMTQSRSHFYRLKRDGFVDSAQVGKNSSRVWLKFVPKEINLIANNFDSVGFWNTYIKGVSQENSLLTPLNEDFTHKIKEIYKGDEGVGVMGCIIIKYVLCVEVLCKNKNKNNIYNKIHMVGVKTDTPDTLPITSPILSIKTEFKGVKTPKTEPTPLNLISDRDTQYFEAKECQNILPCNKEEVLEYLKSNPDTPIKELLNKFGVGVMAMKKEGLIK